MAVAPRFAGLLEVLARHRVEFILVGGVAAILEGAPVSTLDLDIDVFSRPWRSFMPGISIRPGGRSCPMPGSSKLFASTAW
jgi:hypothetical protein